MRASRLSVAIFLGLLGISAVPLIAVQGAAESLPGGSPPVASAVRQSLQDRSYPEARKAIDEAAKAKDAPQDYLAYLKGWSFYLEKRYDEAIAAYTQFEKQYPQSGWARKVRFAKALAWVGKGDFRNAGSTVRAEAEYLLSADRRQQLADIYLEFAGAYYHPAKEDQKPDYEKAREFYAKALEMGLKPGPRAEAELLVAQCYQKTGKIAKAVNAYVKFIADHPASPQEVDACYRLGECRMEEHKFREARRVWQDLLARHADSPSERIAEAAYHLAGTWRIPEPQSREELVQGVAALEGFLARFPTHKLAGQARLAIARSYVHRGRYDEAVAALDRFIKDARTKDCKEVSEAYNLLGQTFQLQKKFPEALAAWREYLVKYPAHEAWSAVQQQIIDAEYLMGQEKYQAGDHEAAARLLTEFLAKYPLDDRNPGILLSFGEMNYRQKKWDAAIADWRRLIEKHPQTGEASRAQLMIARTQEQDLGKPEEALEEYRKVVSRRDFDEAQKAIARLTAQSMKVSTERTFGSDETPRLKLITRNLDAVAVRVYKIDLETYFRKMRVIGGVERLDVSLIDPDVTFEFKVPGFAKYRRIESRIPVPLPEGAVAGVTAVTVGSPAIEATTLVIQSDLGIVAKSSRNEVFVLAENLRTGKPWPGVRLLFADDRQIFEEAATGPGGVFQKVCKELPRGGHVRVFAAAGGHVASSTVRLVDAPIAPGLTDKGYITTDRPAYRAGEQVHVRGCMRHAVGDLYTIEKDKKYTLEVFDVRNRRLRQQEVQLSPFGSFQAEFALPAICPQGVLRVVARDDAGHSFQGTLHVYDDQEPRIELTVDTPRTVYYRGEAIEGTIRATLAGGVPLAGREVSYRVADEADVRATTDAKGEVRFKIPTRDYEGQTLPLAVTLSDHGWSTRQDFTLADEGFSITLGTIRPVFLAGETFEVTIKTADARHQPASEKLRLAVFELVPLQGKATERPIEEHCLTTAADGLARQTLQLKQGGRYLLRAEAADRFNNTITGRLDLRISGEEDRQRLLILADQHAFKLGDTAQVQVYWREAPRLALVAFQGDRVFDHQLVELKTGGNKLSIPITARLAPNFDLSVAVMTDDRPAGQQPPARFHEASSRFSVDQDLQVKLSCRRKGEVAGPVRPGDTVEVTVATSDPRGNPVAAEVSLTMVRQSLLERFARPTAPINQFFRSSTWEMAVATASSVVFSYHPATRLVNPQFPASGQQPVLIEEEEAGRSAPNTRRTIGNPNRGGQQGMMAVAPDAAEDAPQYPVPDKAATVLSSGPVPQDFGYWNPAIVTGTDGKATVELTLPEQPATWTLAAAGLTAQTLVGEAVEHLAVRKDLFGEVKLPAAFTDGDEADVGVSVSNDCLEKGFIEVTLKTIVPGETSKQKTTIEVKGKGRQELGFKTLLRRLERPLDPAFGYLSPQVDAIVELTVAAGDRRDVVRRVVPLLPYGMPVSTAVGGVATGNTTARIEPKRKHWVAPTLRIVVSPTVERSLLDIVAAPASEYPEEAGRTASEVETAASDLMACLALQKLWGGRDDAALQSCALVERIRTSLGLLILAQHNGGGWGWTGAGEPNRSTSAQAAWAVSMARQAGYPVPDDTFHKGLDFLREEASESDNTDFDSKAVLCHALTAAGKGDFAVANHLYRERATLSPVALAYLALALAQMDRKTMAGDLLDLLAKREIEAVAPQVPVKDGLRRCHSDVEIRAIQALALQRVAPNSPQAKETIDWLLAHRSGPRWAPDKATGPAAVALCTWFAENRFAAEPCKLALSVNDSPLRVLEIDPAGATQTVDVPTALLVKGKQRIDFQLTGRGRYAYECVLGGYCPAETMASTSSQWRIARNYEPAPLEFDGREIPRGFEPVETLAPAARFENKMTQLPAGRRGLVKLAIAGKRDSAEQHETLHDDLVITEPIPAGTSVSADSIRGPFDRAEILPGRIVFYVGSDRPIGPITYELDGCRPGTYRAGPTVLRSAYRLQQEAVASPASLTVLPLGAAGSDPYRLTPLELYELGRRMKEKGDLKGAEQHLAELVEKCNLKADVTKRVVDGPPP